MGEWPIQTLYICLEVSISIHTLPFLLLHPNIKLYVYDNDVNTLTGVRMANMDMFGRIITSGDKLLLSPL